MDTMQRKASEYKAGMLEGGEGYNPYAAAAREEKMAAIAAAKVAAMWTRDETIARRAEFNAAVKAAQAAGRTNGLAVLESVQQMLGYTRVELVNNIQHHNLG